MTDLFMPSGDELFLFDQTRDETQAVTALLSRGIRTIVVKRGDQGASLFEAGRRVDVPPLTVHELDPTGAGDSFDAGLLWALLAGWELPRALPLACVCGALSTRATGGTAAQPTLDEALERL